MEAAFIGAIWSAATMPTQGLLGARATGADGLVEPTIVHQGKRWTIKHVIDSVHGAHSVVVSGPDGELWKKAGQKVFAAWVDDNMPQRSVVLASLFSHQKSEGFVEMKSGDRMAVLLRVIGVERLERKAKLAREFAAAERGKLEELCRRIGDIRGDDPGIEAAAAALRAAEEAAAGADAAVVEAKAALAKVQQAAADQVARKAAREAADKLRAALEEQAKGAAERRADSELKIQGNRQFQAQAAEIRAAAEHLEAANTELTRLELGLVEADKQIAKLLDPWRDGPARARAAAQRRDAAAKRLKDKAAIDRAVSEQAALAAAATAARALVEATEIEIRTMDGKRWATADERFVDLRASLVEIENLESDLGLAPVIAHKALAADDDAITTATETPAKIKELRSRLDSEKDRMRVAERAQADADKQAARAADVASAEAEHAAAGKEAAEITEGHAIAVLSAVLRALGRRELAVAAKAQATMLEPMRKLAGRLAALDDSERRIGELEGLIAAAQAEEARVAEQISMIEVVEAGETPDAGPAREAVAASEKTAGAAKAAVTKADLALARSREIDAKVVGLEAERLVVESELADWTRLVLDHGRGGMQAAEVDNAGPELTTYINDLLRHCGLNRWTMYVQTKHLDSTGKKMIDGVQIRVVDNETGEDKEVSEHSGGERCSLAEAIRSGMVILACQRAGFDRPTLVRDESTNFLDEVAAPLWVKMMRRVVQFTNADRLLFVSHNADIVRLADATIEPPARRKPAEIGAAA
ncbi:MAG TPA: hypothetical protein VJN18_32520 [Polyangiaceae bacterium]|nr:hypothetical protein [Polyangiaceae bacterium]